MTAWQVTAQPQRKVRSSANALLLREVLTVWPANGIAADQEWLRVIGTEIAELLDKYPEIILRLNHIPAVAKSLASKFSQH